METVGFAVFCLAIAGVIYWSLIMDDRLGEDENGLFPGEADQDS
jgi:hypothetical protein